MLDYKDLPGGRTGEAGLNAAQRLQQGLGGVGHNALDTNTFLNLEKRIRTPEQLKTFLNSNPEQPNYYEKIMANPVTKQMVQSYFNEQARGGDLYAEMYLAQIVGGGGTQGVAGGNAGLARRAFLSSPAIQQLRQTDPDIVPLLEGLTHQSIGENIAAQQADQRLQRHIGIMGAAGMTASGGSGGALPGLPAAVEQEIRQSAVARGLDPEHMVRLARQEGGVYEQGGSIYSRTSPKGAFGPMQLMPDNMKAGGITTASPWQANVRVGVQQYNALLNTYLKDHTPEEAYVLADAAYNAGPNNPGVQRFAATGDPGLLPDETKNYIRRIDSGGVPGGLGESSSGATPGMPGQNMPPPEALEAQAHALAMAMSGSETSFNEMNVILPWINNQLKDFADNLKKVNSSASWYQSNIKLGPWIMGPNG